MFIRLLGSYILSNPIDDKVNNGKIQISMKSAWTSSNSPDSNDIVQLAVYNLQNSYQYLFYQTQYTETDLFMS